MPLPVIILYNDDVTEYLSALVVTLYEKEYKSFIADAENYVSDLYAEIEKKIATCSVHKDAPLHFCRYGKQLKYVTVRQSKHTAWYVFFLQKDNRYIVTYITNNHVAAQHIAVLEEA